MRAARSAVILPADEIEGWRTRAAELGMFLPDAVREGARRFLAGHLPERLCPACRGPELLAEDPDIDPAFAHWLAGFIDGEGCFIIARNTDRRRAATVPYARYTCRLQVRLRDDDIGILQEIRDRTGLGAVSRLKLVPSVHDRKPQALWNVVTRDDVMSTVRLLDRYPLRAKKARDYAIWREAVLECNRVGRSGGAATAFDWSRLADLFEQLKAVRVYQEVALDEVA